MGDGLVLAAFPLITVHISRTPSAVAGVMLAATLPQFLVALPAGLVTDRAERRRLMAGATALAAAALAVLALLLGTVSVGLAALDAVAFVVGTAQVVIVASGSALLPQVAASEDLERANAWMFSMQHAVGTLGGPPLAGVLVAAWLAAPIWAAAACYLLAATVLTASRAQFRGSDTKRASGPLADLTEGVKFVVGHRQLRTFTAITTMANIASNAAVVVLVLYAVAPGPLELSRAGYGLLLSCGGLGAITGSAVSKWITRRVGRGSLLTGSVLAIAVGLAGPGLLVNPYTTGAAFAIAGFGVGSYNVISVSFRQRVVPAEMLGRATAAYRLAGMGAVPLGAVLGGLSANAFGLRGSFLAAGALTLVCLACMPAVTEGALRFAEG